jgi:hypothetical protein
MRISRLAPAVVAALLAAGLATPAAGAAPGRPAAARHGSFRERVTAYRPTGRLQVRFASGVTPVRERAAYDRVTAAGHTLRVDRRIPGLNAVVVSVDSARAVQALLRSDSSVRYVEPESRYQAFVAEPVSPELHEIGADAVHDAVPSNVGLGSEIAVLDSQVDASNADLDDAGKVAFVGDFSTDVPSIPGDPYDTQDFACDPAHCPHGTAVAAVAAADAGDDGMAGVAPGAKIKSYNVFRRFVYTNPDPQPGDPTEFESVSANSGDIAAALADIAANGSPGLVAVNMSLGGTFDNRLVRDAIAAVHAAKPKITVVVSSGNDGGERANYPSGDPFVLSVGATGQHPDSGSCATAVPANTPWTVTGFSNRGDVDVVAPGRCVTSWYPPEDEETGAVTGPAVLTKVDGTSFSAPMVAGVVALLGAATVPVTGDAARAAVMSGADHTGQNVAIGVGRAKAPGALDRGDGPGPYTALSIVRGGQVATSVGRRSVEALRVNPAGPAPAAPTITVPAAFGTIVGGSTSSSGTVTRRTATYVATPDNKSGQGSSVTATGSAGAGDTAPVPVKLLDAGDNVEGLPVASNEQTSVPLTFGSRSAYVRSANVASGSNLTWSWTFDPNGWSNFANLYVWEPASNGGTADAASEPVFGADQEESTVTLMPGGDDCEQTGPSSFRTCRPGRYLVGWLLSSSFDDSDPATRYRLKLSYTGPVATLTTPPVASTVTASGPFRVYWAGPRAVKWDVYYTQKKKSGSSWVLGPWVPWQIGTTAPSAPFGTGGSPVAVAPGYTYHFQVRAYDALGNPSLPVSASTSEPLDDASYHLGYSTGWSKGPASNRWLSTLHATTVQGASVQVSSETERFTVVGDRCAVCGAFRVYIDGVLKGEVNTYASSTVVRQSLWTSALLPGGPKPHTFKLVALGTKGHPKVVVDGVATQR